MLRKNCPDYDPNTPLCCNDDQAEILNANFIQIDTVFGLDCPICAVNIKRMWCEYTCNPNKANFVKGLGYQISLHLTQTMPARSFNHARRYLSLLRLLCKVQLPSLISWASMESSKVTQSLGLNSQKTQMSHSVLQPTLAIHWHQQMETLVTIQKSVTVPAPLATQHAQLLQLMPLLASSMVSMEHSWV